MNFYETLATPFCHLLVQLLIIITLAQILGKGLEKIGQPAVIGEILAGIFLGPSVLGFFFPSQFQVLFDKESLGTLQIISQLGLIFFMFTVGLHSQPISWTKTGRKALIISNISILFPFVLGMGLASFLREAFSSEKVSYIEFSFFMGISLSITAFPVLARIIRDRNLSHDETAQMALNCAAIDDISAWTILAGIIGISRQQGINSLFTTLVFSGLGIFVLLKIVSPFSKFLIEKKQLADKHQFLLGLLVLLISSLYFEGAGVHALFGAFLAGVAMPAREEYRHFLQDRVESLAGLIFLPSFFAITGLRTQITLLNSWETWLICAGIISLAILGKLGGAALASKWCGYTWKDSLFLGILMNTRGLIELVALNIGLELKIISPTLFTMMVIMALFTTMMTGPCLSLLKDSSHLKKVMSRKR